MNKNILLRKVGQRTFPAKLGSFFWGSACAVATLMLCSCASDYVNAVKALLGDQYKYYYVYTIPSESGGVGTSFDATGMKSPLSPDAYVYDRNAPIGDAWATFNISQATVTNLSEADKLRMDGFASYSSATDFARTNTTFRGGILSATLAKISSEFGLSTSLGDLHNATTSIQFDSCGLRAIDRNKFDQYIDSTNANEAVVALYRNHELGMIGQDVVVKGLSVTVTLTNIASADVQAFIASVTNNPVSSAANVNGPQIELTGYNTNTETYTFGTTNTVVIAGAPSLYVPRPLTNSPEYSLLLANPNVTHTTHTVVIPFTVDH